MLKQKVKAVQNYLIFGACIMALSSVLLIGAVSHAQAADIVDRIVAVVNDEIITLSDLNQAFRPYLGQVKSMGYSLEKQRQMLFKAREQVLDQMIDEKLTDQEIQRARLQISDKEIETAIEQIKTKNYFSDEDMRDMLLGQGYTMETYREELRKRMLRQRLVRREVKSKIIITDDDIAAYYAKNSATYAGKKKYHLRHIIKRAPAWADKGKKQKILSAMEDILKQLKAGESFSALAKAHSESPSGKKDGDLGVFVFDSLSPKLQKAIQGLKSGQFTSVLDTDQGYQIFYIKEISQSSGTTLTDAKAEIQDKLYQEVVNRKFQAWIGDLRKRSHIKIIR